MRPLWQNMFRFERILRPSRPTKRAPAPQVVDHSSSSYCTFNYCPWIHFDQQRSHTSISHWDYRAEHWSLKETRYWLLRRSEVGGQQEIRGRRSEVRSQRRKADNRWQGCYPLFVISYSGYLSLWTDLTISTSSTTSTISTVPTTSTTSTSSTTFTVRTDSGHT